MYNEKTIIRAMDARAIIREIDLMSPKLPREVVKPLHLIILKLVTAYGEEGLYQRVNNKSIAEVLAEFGNDDRPVATGIRDGVRFELYESPGADRSKPIDSEAGREACESQPLDSNGGVGS